MNSFKNKLTSALVAGAICSLSSFANSTPITIDFTTTPDYSSQDKLVSELSYSELTISGSSDISVNYYRNGLGVVGGSYDRTIDSSEWLLFDFLSPVTNVQYQPWTYGSNTVQVVEAFNLSGSSLGTVQFDGIIAPHKFDLTEVFGGELLSSFKLQVTEGLFKFKSVSFETVVSVPAPSGQGILFLSALLLFSARKVIRE